MLQDSLATTQGLDDSMACKQFNGATKQAGSYKTQVFNELIVCRQSNGTMIQAKVSALA